MKVYVSSLSAESGFDSLTLLLFCHDLNQKTNSDFQVAFEFNSLRCTSLLPSVSSFSFLHEVKEYSAKQIISAYQLVNHDGILALFALKRTPPCACTTILKME